MLGRDGTFSSQHTRLHARKKEAWNWYFEYLLRRTWYIFCGYFLLGLFQILSAGGRRGLVFLFLTLSRLFCDHRDV